MRETMRQAVQQHRPKQPDVEQRNELAESTKLATEVALERCEQLAVSIRSTAAVSEESAASAEEVSASTEEQTAGVVQMSASAREMAALAIQLHALVGHFVVGEEGIGQLEEGRAGSNAPGERLESTGAGRVARRRASLTTGNRPLLDYEAIARCGLLRIA